MRSNEVVTIEELAKGNRLCSNCGLRIYADTEEEYNHLVESCKESDEEQPDWSPGEVIAAYEDGTIVLDDGVTTWNPERAVEFLRCQSVECNSDV